MNKIQIVDESLVEHPTFSFLDRCWRINQAINILYQSCWKDETHWYASCGHTGNQNLRLDMKRGH